MKYKCIKDYWMDGDSADEGHTPAFVEGDVYEFNYCITEDDPMVTYKDNHKCKHFMDKDELDNSGYFELVEE